MFELELLLSILDTLGSLISFLEYIGVHAGMLKEEEIGLIDYLYGPYSATCSALV